MTPLRWYCRQQSRTWLCRAASSDPLAFHCGLPGYDATPLIELPPLARELDVGRVFVKDESSRLGLPAFKVLGASWAIASVVADRAGLDGPLTLADLRSATAQDRFVLVTATDGNHGRAVARVGALLGLPTQVFVPDVITERSVAAIAGEGATVTMVSGSYDDAVARAAREAAARPDAVLLQDTAWPGYEEIPARIVEGYQTLLLEADAQLVSAGVARPGLVAVPVGVGSLAQAVVRHYRSCGDVPGPSVVGVEPDNAACVLASLTRGRLTTVPTAATVMAGLNCGTPSSLAWPTLRDGLDAAVAVADDAVAQAVADLAELGVSSGPSGAATLAGVRALLTGDRHRDRRRDLGLDSTAVVVLLSTEARTGATNPPPTSPWSS